MSEARRDLLADGMLQVGVRFATAEGKVRAESITIPGGLWFADMSEFRQRVMAMIDRAAEAAAEAERQARYAAGPKGWLP